MANIFRLALILLFFSPSFCIAQDKRKDLEGDSISSDKNLPNAVQAELEKFQKNIAKASQSFAESSEKARKTTVFAMEKQIKAAMKRRDLESAIEIKNKIKELNSANLWSVGEASLQPTEGSSKGKGDNEFMKARTRQAAQPFPFTDGYWESKTQEFGIVKTGQKVHWVKGRKKLDWVKELVWDAEKLEYKFAQFGIRMTAAGLKIMNYDNGHLGGLKASPLDLLKN